MQAASYSEGCKDLKSMTDKLVADHASLAITVQGGEGGVVISASEWAAIEETLLLLSSPKNAERFLEAVRAGRLVQRCPQARADWW